VLVVLLQLKKGAFLMSRALISRSSDLEHLRDEGYCIEIRGGFLLLHEVPYVNAHRQVCNGTLISPLCLAGDVTHYDHNHVAHFIGEFPCEANGTPIHQIYHQSGDLELGSGIKAQHAFSSRPPDGYRDYYHKMTTYVAILSGPAEVLQPGVSPRIFQQPEEGEASVFNYIDTASTRAGIGTLTERLAGEKVGIIGLGGTGSYVLDLVAKTPVQEIHLFDSDRFLQHNAFRAPGAASIDALLEAPLKVQYWAEEYLRMRHFIFPHAVAITADTLHFLEGLSFVFICIDGGLAKGQIIQKLEVLGTSFIDVGMGLELVDGKLGGILRVTVSTPDYREHVHQGRIPLGGGEADNVYNTNIQVADLNSLNATLAVMKWKKLCGFYRDYEREHHSTFTTDGNMLLNEECG
jgi:hypothetical protein